MYQLQCILRLMLTIRINGNGPIGNLGCLGKTGQNCRALSPVFIVVQRADAFKIPILSAVKSVDPSLTTNTG